MGIYHASLVGQSGTKIRGKIARTLACKSSLASRVDAFDHENNDAELGLQLRKAVERRIENLTHGKTGRYTKNITSNIAPVATVIKTKKYQTGADIKAEPESKKRKIVELKTEVKDEPAAKKKKKKKK